jgi:hypothetical protein
MARVRRRVRRVTVTLGLAAALALAGPAAAFAGVVGDWGMDETAGSTLMVDSTTNDLDGTIGSDVVLHEMTGDGGYAYRFKGDWRIVNDNRLVNWPDDERLDPGTSTFAVTIRLKTGALDPNIIQKGQANQAGGYWKFVLKKGWPRCHFRDEFDNTKAIGFVNSTLPGSKVADGQWHTLRCERTTTGVKMTINYGEPNEMSKFIKGTIGNIDNSRPMSLGGKLDCNGADVTCDYFAGAVDWVRIEKG